MTLIPLAPGTSWRYMARRLFPSYVSGVGGKLDQVDSSSEHLPPSYLPHLHVTSFICLSATSSPMKYPRVNVSRRLPIYRVFGHAYDCSRVLIQGSPLLLTETKIVKDEAQMQDLLSGFTRGIPFAFRCAERHTFLARRLPGHGSTVQHENVPRVRPARVEVSVQLGGYI
jgi:hypothetical protein